MAGFIRRDTQKLTILSTAQLNKDHKDMIYSGEGHVKGLFDGKSHHFKHFMVFALVFKVTPLEKEAPKHSFSL